MLLSKEIRSDDPMVLHILQDVETNAPEVISAISQLTEKQFWTLIEFRTPLDGQSVLHIAATSRNFDFIREMMLLPRLVHARDRLVALVNAQNSARETVLHQVLGEDSLDEQLPLLLLRAGANPWLPDINKETVFYLACFKGLCEVVEYILCSSSAQQPLSKSLVNGVTVDGLTPLSIALTRGHTAVVNVIRRHLSTMLTMESALDNIIPDHSRATPFQREFSNRIYPLHVICSSGDVEQLRNLSASVISKEITTFDKCGVTPLFIACNNVFPQIVQMLLTSGADARQPCTTPDGITPLIVACCRGSVEIARILLDAGADPNQHRIQDDATPLIIACSHGFDALVALLIERGAQVNYARHIDGATAFSVAWAQRHFGVLKVLLSAEGQGGSALLDHDSTSSAILDLLRLAVNNSESLDWTVIHLLLERLHSRAHRSHAGEQTNTLFLLDGLLQELLPVVVTRRDSKLVRLLLEHNHSRSIGSAQESLLLVAIRNNSDIETVRLLLDHGADPNQPLPLPEEESDTLIRKTRKDSITGNNNNNTMIAASAATNWPIQLAVENHSVELLKLLLTHARAPSIQVSMQSTRRRETLLWTALSQANLKLTHLILAAGGARYKLPTTRRTDVPLLRERNLSGLELTEDQVVKLLKHDHPDLVSLNLSSNALAQLDIHRWHQQFQSLHTLQLSHNVLQQVPRGLARLSGLTILDLSFNPITNLESLFDDPQGLPISLREFYLRRTPLASLPLQLHKLTSLLRFDVDPEVFVTAGIPESIARLSARELKDYLQALEEKSLHWNQTKLVFVGEENVGKTTLIKYLTNSLPLSTKDSQNISTDGVDVIDWECISTANPWRYYCSSCFSYFPPPAADNNNKHNGSQTYRCASCKTGVLIADSLSLSVWDFGGQEIFYSTHPLFLSDKSIFVVVFDISNINFSRIEYWLRQVNSIATNRPPILLVGTHRDQCSESTLSNMMKMLEFKFRQPWCGNVRVLLSVSCTQHNRTGVDELRSTLISTARSMLSTQIVPAYYLVLQHLIIHLKHTSSEKDFIPLSILQRTIAERIPALALRSRFSLELPAALSFFHSTGLLLYFNDIPQLRDLVILDPRWLTRMMATIITFKPNFVDKQTAQLSFQDLQHVWKAYPRELHPRLLVLLTRFGIAYQLPSGSLLFPSLLTTEMPSVITSPNPIIGTHFSNTYGRIYRFELLPLGLFARITVGILSSAVLENNTDRYRLWMNGLAIWWDSCSLAILHYETSALELRLLLISALESASARLTAMIDVVESVVSGFYSTYANQISRWVVCSHCLTRSMIASTTSDGCSIAVQRLWSGTSKSLFPLTECLAALELGIQLTCHLASPTSIAIPLQETAPDLALTGVTILREADVCVTSEIGSGAFGQVWLGHVPRRILSADSSGQAMLVAVKSLRGSSERYATSPQDEVLQLLSLHREVAMMSRLHHPNLLRLFGVVLLPLRMVLEYAPLGDLYKLLHDQSTLPNEQFNWRLRIRIALDIALGVEYLHDLSPPIIHRDLRSPNVFLMRLHESAPVVAKVADFGLAQSLVVQSGLTDRLETWQWMAPEAFGVHSSAVSYTERADVYSFGIVLWELATRKFPFEEFLEEKNCSVFKLKAGICREVDPIRPTIDPSIAWPDEYASLTRACWHALPAERPSFYEIVRRLRRCLAVNRSAVRMPMPTTAPKLVPHHLFVLPTSSGYAVALLAVVTGNDVTQSRVWIGCNTGVIHVADETGKLLSSLLSSHRGRVYSLCETKQRDPLVISASEDRIVHIWSSTTLQLLYTIPYREGALMRCAAVVSANNSNDNGPSTHGELWVTDTEGGIEAWTIGDTAELNLTLRHSVRLLGTNVAICSLFQLPYDRAVVVGCAEGSLIKLHPVSLRELHRHHKAHRGRINALCATSDDYLASGSDDYTIGIWNYKLDLLHRVSIHSGKIHVLSLFGSSYLMSAGFDLKLCLYDLTNVQRHLKHGGWPESACFELLNVTTDSITSAARMQAQFSHLLWIASRDGQIQIVKSIL